MTNKPKAIGTWGESAVLKIVKPYFPDAHRLVLAGQSDEGDIWCNNDLIIEVKAGAQTKQVGDATLTKWLGEAAQEALNSGAAQRPPYPYVRWVLVIQRHGYGKDNADRWWAYVSMNWLQELLGGGAGIGPTAPKSVPVRLELGQLLDWLARGGWTTEIPDAADA